MSYLTYKIVHFIGIFSTLIALGGITFHMLQGGTRENFVSRKMVGKLHGIGLFLALLGGFGMMAKGHFKLSQDLWLWGKIVVWLLLGASPVFFYRVSNKAKLGLGGLFTLLLLAVFLVEFKPF